MLRWNPDKYAVVGLVMDRRMEPFSSRWDQVEAEAIDRMRTGSPRPRNYLPPLPLGLVSRRTDKSEDTVCLGRGDTRGCSGTGTKLGGSEKDVAKPTEDGLCRYAQFSSLFRGPNGAAAHATTSNAQVISTPRRRRSIWPPLSLLSGR